LDNKSCYIT